MTSEGEVRAPSEPMKPCPFCGGPGVIARSEGGQVVRGYYPWITVMCDDCDSAGESHKSDEEAIAAWNRRLNAEPSRAPGVGEAPLGWVVVEHCEAWARPSISGLFSTQADAEDLANRWRKEYGSHLVGERTYTVEPLGSARVPEGEADER